MGGANYYSQAIDIVLDNRVDFKAMVVEIAKKHPKLVVDAASKQIRPNKPWQEQCLPLLVRNEKISAIKLCRELTGMGLKEAKEAVEGLIP